MGSCLERRTIVVPWRRGLATGRCRLPSVYIWFRLYVLRGESFRTVLFDCLKGKRVSIYPILGERTNRRPDLPGPTPPRRLTMRRAAPDRPWGFLVGFGFDRYGNYVYEFVIDQARYRRYNIPGHAMHAKGMQRRQQPGTKSGCGPARKPAMNRLSTAGFVPIGLHRVSFVCASRDTPKFFFQPSGG